MSASPSPDPVSPGANGERRPSFSFLRRQKSHEQGRNVLKKQKGQPLYYQPQPTIPNFAPQIPSHEPLPSINSFGGNEYTRGLASSVTSQHAPNFVGDEGHHSDSNNFAGYHAMPYQPSSPPQPVRPLTSSSTLPPPPLDPYAKTESMAHRGRYSYASSAISVTGINSPRRVRRRKDPTPFNILVIGAKNCGKTSFIDFLKYALKLKVKSGRGEKTPTPPGTALPPDSPFTPHYLETDIDHERIGVTLWDSQGLEKKFVDLQLREMTSFIESKFEDTFTEEQKVMRSPGARDTHIHCVFLILDPSRLDANSVFAKTHGRSIGRFNDTLRLRGILDEDLDVQVLQALQGKTTVIPVISKADTITTTRMAALKKAVWDSIKEAKLDPLEALTLAGEDAVDGDESAYASSGSDREDSELIERLVDRSSDDGHMYRGGAVKTPPTSPPKPELNRLMVPNQPSPSNKQNRLSAAIYSTTEGAPFIPMSIISPDGMEPGIIGRRFPWGFADPYNSQHCDFVRLKDSVFSEWRIELREASREMWYEGWRTSRLKRRVKSSTNIGTAISVNKPRTTSAAKNGAAYSKKAPAQSSRVLSGSSTVDRSYNRSPALGPGSSIAARSQSDVSSITGGTNAITADTAVTAPLPAIPNRVNPGHAGSDSSAHASSPPVPMPHPGSPEMVGGMYRKGVNAF